MTKATKNNFEKPFYANFREIGMSLKEMGSSVINTTHQKVMSQWFHSESDVDIVLWKDERKNIIKQQVNLFGQVIEWNIVEGLKTGFVVETESPAEKNGEKPKPNVIRYDNSPQRNSIHQAVDIVRYAALLIQTDKDVLINNFLNAPKITSMDPAIFVETFGKNPKPLSTLATLSNLSLFQKILRRFFK